jgi:hypothetical protein
MRWKRKDILDIQIGAARARSQQCAASCRLGCQAMCIDINVSIFHKKI